MTIAASLAGSLRTGVVLAVAIISCRHPPVPDAHRAPGTTSGAIALANLAHQIAQHADEPGGHALLLARARFTADPDALDRATALTEPHSATATELLARAQTRAAGHRFRDALADLAAAAHAGAPPAQLADLRAAILVGIGRADEALPTLVAGVIRAPGFATYSALASAEAALGHLVEADQLYRAAWSTLTTTSPFPYAWISFARALMWTEQGGDPGRGEALYREALVYLPGFTTAQIHLAELEAARGDLASAITRLAHVTATRDEPEAHGQLGALLVRTGDPIRGQREIERARQRYTTLLVRHPLAYADHAAEFYLGPGHDPARACQLAQQNLAARHTPRALALAAAAARATGHARGCARVN